MHPLDSLGRAELARLQAAPDSAGTLVYSGAVFAQQAGPDEQLFSYERRVVDGVGSTTATHITRDMHGRVIIVERAQFGAGYALQRFEAVNAQQGWRGSATVSADGRRLDFALAAAGRDSTAREAVLLPLVSGPSLHGFILRHWDVLVSGQTLPVRMVVMAGRTTYGFVIRRQAGLPGRVVFSVTPSQWLIRLAVAPLQVSFDAATRHIVRYEGRVPPMRARAWRLAALDARVDYTPAWPTYR